MNEILTKSSITEIKRRMFYPINKTPSNITLISKEDKSVGLLLTREKVVEEWEFIDSTNSWERVSKGQLVDYLV